MAKRAQNLVKKGAQILGFWLRFWLRTCPGLEPFWPEWPKGLLSHYGQKGSRPGSDLLRTYLYTVGNWPKPVQDWPGLVRMAKMAQMAILTTFGRS